jgi:hypothetical protein
MGKLPNDFEGDRDKADDFIEEVKGYLRFNREVPGLGTPMKKMAFTLTHIKGPKVAGWARDMGTIYSGSKNRPNVWLFCKD